MADTTGRLQASESAATTASRIFSEAVGSNSYEYGGGGYGAPMLGRSTSSNSLRSQYASYDDPGLYGGGSLGGRVRRNSFNTINGPGMISSSPTGYGGGLAMPPSPTMLAANPAYGGAYGQPGLYGGGQLGYGGQAGYMGAGGLGQYPGQGIHQSLLYGQGGYSGGSGGYGGYGSQYPGQSVGLPVPPGGTVVIQTPSSSSRSHRHHHRRHSGRTSVEYALPGTAYSAGY